MCVRICNLELSFGSLQTILLFIVQIFFVLFKFFLSFQICFYRCYYPHTLREAVSPLCGIFFQTVCTVVKSQSQSMGAVKATQALLSFVGRLLIIRKGSVLAIRAGHYIYQDAKCPCYRGQILHLLEWEVSLIIWQDTTFIRKGSVLAIKAHYIYQEGKCPCYQGWTLNL